MKKTLKYSLYVVFTIALNHAQASTSFLDKTEASVTLNHFQVGNEGLAYAFEPTAPNREGRTFYIEPAYDNQYSFSLTHQLYHHPNLDASDIVFEFDELSSKEMNQRYNGSSVFLGGAIAGANASHQASINHKLNIWRLGLRHKKSLKFLDVKLGAFFEYIKHEKTFDIHSKDLVAGQSAQQYHYQKFEGIGPHLEIMGTLYPFKDKTAMNLFAKTGMGLIFSDYSNNIKTSLNGIYQPNTYYPNQDINRMMTRIDVAVGLAYSRPISKGLVMGYALGARFVTFFNALNQSHPFNLKSHDLNYGGPFLEIKIGGHSINQ